MAGTAFLFAAAAALQSFHSQPQITVDLQPWQYLTRIQFGLDHAAAPGEESVLGLDQASFPSEAAPLVIRKVAPHRTHPKIAVVTTHDQMTVTQAATVQPAQDRAASVEQIQAFQNMHRQLRMQLFAALRGEAPLNTQLAIQSPAQPVLAVVTANAPVAVTHPVQHKSATVVKEVERALPEAKAQAREIKMPELTQAPSIQARAQLASADTVPASTQLLVPVAIRTGEKRQLAADSTASQPAESRLLAPEAGHFGSYDVFREETEATYKQITNLSEHLFGTAEVTTHPAPATPQAIAAKSAPGVSVLISQAAGYPVRSDYSSLDLYKMWLALNTHSNASPAPAAPVQATQPPQPKVEDGSLTQSRPVQVADARQNVLVVDDVPTPVVPNQPAVVEAFEWNTGVEQVTSDIIATEGWKRLQAANHWPVIYWNPDSQAQAAMISHNTAVSLAKIADVDLQPDAAIVFGKIPAGWNVEYSDRAEKVLYLNAQNQADLETDGVRYFAFLNAAPGAQLVTLKAAIGAETAAVAVPVLNGSSTYLDLTAVTKRAFSGYVLDATASQRKPISGATVSVVGQPNAVFFTTESGYFHLSEVYAVGTYPVFAETATATGFKHRYHMSPNRLDGIELYRMGDKQVQTWIGQLEGGVSPESGLIVAATPKLTQASGDGRLFPSAHPILGNSTLTPETYTLSDSGELEVGKPLEAQSSRFISVQVPGGPVVSQVEDNNRNVIWSELVVAQPGVINIVGPY